MLYQHYTTSELKSSEKLAYLIKKEDRMMLGCKAMSGISVTKLSNKYNINRQFIYEQKNKVHDILEKEFDKSENKYSVLILDEQIIEKTIIACMIICKGSETDAQEFMEEVYKIHVSIGKISEIINKASDKALEWNNSIKLENITTGANDEIFQGNTPVLVGVDPLSTYAYLMQETENRDSTTCARLLWRSQPNLCQKAIALV